jgi:cation:H+ antiporter
MNIHSLPANIAILLISALVISRSIKIFISSSTKLAQLLKISEYTISFLVVSVATSLPELVVAITSGLQKNSILSYGDAIGSNLALLTLVMALPVLIGHSLSTKDIIRSNDIYYSAFFLTLALAMALDGVITRIDGTILVAGYLYYSRSVLKRGTTLENLLDTFKREKTNVWKEAVLFVVSLLLLLAASQGIVGAATDISQNLNISMGFVGLTITALGTSLPEIAFVLEIMRSNGNKEEIMGDVVGSVVANSTLVLGTAALILPNNQGASQFGF